MVRRRGGATKGRINKACACSAVQSALHHVAYDVFVLVRLLKSSITSMCFTSIGGFLGVLLACSICCFSCCFGCFS